MNREEIIRRLNRIASHAVHVIGEEPFTLSLDDGIAASEAALLLKKQEAKLVQNFESVVPNIDVACCPSCNNLISNRHSKPTHYCNYCGQKVRWHD